MKNESNGVLIGLVVFLVAIILGLVGYIIYDKELILDNENKIEENNKENETNKEEVIEQSVPTNMNLVTSKLDELGLNQYVMHEYWNWNKENLLNDSSSRLTLINAYFMKNNLTSSGCDDQCAIISLDTYKAKYEEVYGSLDNFENDTNNSPATVFSISDGNNNWNIPNGYVHWNKVWGASEYVINLQATSVTYDENNKNYVIDGNMMATQWNNDTESFVSFGSKGTFKITYVNDDTKRYLTSITILSTEN